MRTRVAPLRAAGTSLRGTARHMGSRSPRCRVSSQSRRAERRGQPPRPAEPAWSLFQAGRRPATRARATWCVPLAWSPAWGRSGRRMKLIPRALAQPRSREARGAYPLRTCLRTFPLRRPRRSPSRRSRPGSAQRSPGTCPRPTAATGLRSSTSMWCEPLLSGLGGPKLVARVRLPWQRERVARLRPSPGPVTLPPTAFHHGLPYAYAAGADGRILIPNHLPANVPGRAREVWGAHPLRTPLRTRLFGGLGRRRHILASVVRRRRGSASCVPDRFMTVRTVEARTE